jgi:hypothetical protein
MNAMIPLAFAEPWLLLGLASLPILWWLLRLMPPRPRRIAFPPTRLLFDIAPKEETPARTPWWLTLLRLTAAALVILAVAAPVWNPRTGAAQSTGPLVVLIDDGWSAASTWDMRIKAADEAVASAESNRRSVAIVPLSDANRDLSLQPAGAARIALRQLSPVAYAVDRNAALPSIARLLSAAENAELIWLSDGIDGGKGAEFVRGLAETIKDRALTVVDGGLDPVRALAAVENSAARMAVTLYRLASPSATRGTVRATDIKGAPLGEARFAFNAGDRESEAAFDLPIELRNDIARLEIMGERSSGAVFLTDKRWRRRAIGIVSGASTDTAQPLLAPTYYLTRALAPFADVRLAERGAPANAVTQLLDQKLPMIVLADVGGLPADLRDRVANWVDRGGVLVRFAGPRLAAATEDPLIPVRIRRGDRNLGGSLTWEKPQQLAAFPAESPFAHIAVPSDVTVTRQVLAEPGPGVAAKTWAALADGTPLVTGERRGKGLVVLFHVSADARWSNLPLSGAFVDMLRSILDLAGTAPADAAADTKVETLAPTRIMDGFGVFGPPPAFARPVRSDHRGAASRDFPPGFYGPPDAPFAVNTLTASDRLVALDLTALKARHASYRAAEPFDLRGYLLGAALTLFLIDAILVAVLGGGLARLLRWRRPAAAALSGLVIAIFAIVHHPASAQDQPAAINAVGQTRLAYVVTGNADVDSIVKAGLQGLTVFLAQRTALEGGEPVGVDPARDELAFYPLVYWPIIPGMPKPPQATLDRIDAYMKQGGTVLFDTRDAGEAPSVQGGETQTPGMATLRRMLSSLDIPELEPVPREHVMTKTFYLLRDFPGRYGDGKTWVEALPRETDADASDRPARGSDGVSPIIITSNDLAGAWALRPDGQPMLPLSGGDPRQREFAFRAGVNIVMYTLTGNYKADQVHVPALIERLGQ